MNHEETQLRIIALICGTSTDLVVLSGADPFLEFCLTRAVALDSETFVRDPFNRQFLCLVCA